VGGNSVTAWRSYSWLSQQIRRVVLLCNWNISHRHTKSVKPCHNTESLSPVPSLAFHVLYIYKISVWRCAASNCRIIIVHTMKFTSLSGHTKDMDSKRSVCYTLFSWHPYNWCMIGRSCLFSSARIVLRAVKGFQLKNLYYNSPKVGTV
jgi:hypothetical protein